MALGKRQKAAVSTNTEGFATDPLVEIKGSECLVGLECFLNMVRALGMGSCLSGDVASAHALPYALAAAAAVTAPTSASDVGSDNKSGNLRKKMRRDTSFDTKLEMWLHRVPERLFLNGSSEVASLFSKQGKKGINQDAMIVWEVSPFNSPVWFFRF